MSNSDNFYDKQAHDESVKAGEVFDAAIERRLSEHQVTEAEMAWKWVEGEVGAKGYCPITGTFYGMLGRQTTLFRLLRERGWAIARNFSSGADVDEYVVYRRKA